jgi:hypothetical protein
MSYFYSIFSSFFFRPSPKLQRHTCGPFAAHRLKIAALELHSEGAGFVCQPASYSDRKLFTYVLSVQANLSIMHLNISVSCKVLTYSSPIVIFTSNSTLQAHELSSISCIFGGELQFPSSTLRQEDIRDGGAGRERGPIMHRGIRTTVRSWERFPTLTTCTLHNEMSLGWLNHEGWYRWNV